MFHPFFDPSPLSNKELMEKIDEVSQRIASARMSGIKYEIIQTMFSVIDACNSEMETRAALKELDGMKDSCVFDLDEYLKPKEELENESKRKQNYRPGW